MCLFLLIAVGLTRGVAVYDTSQWANSMEGILYTLPFRIQLYCVVEVFEMKTSAQVEMATPQIKVGTTHDGFVPSLTSTTFALLFVLV